MTVEGNTAVLRNENCIHQAVEIIPAQELTMSCSVSRYGTEPQWSGLSFSYYDENWNFISEPNAAQITGLSYNQYTVTDTAPLNAKYAGVWIYTSTGVGVRSCSFKSGGGTTQPPEPPQPPSSNELLSNPNFNNQLSGWSRCNNNSGLSVQGNVAVLNSANCLHQDLDAFASQSFNLSCQARQLSDNDWTGVGLSFYDASWNFISEPSPTQVSNGSFSDYNVSGTAPATARYIAAWVYTSGSAEVNFCSLTSSGSTEPPEPTEPPTPSQDESFCPAYEDSPLYRARSNTLILSANDDDWERKILDAPADTEILLSNGEYLLDFDTIFMTKPDITIRSLSGNRDDVVIRGLGFYTGSSEGFMIASDRVTIADMTMYGMRRHAVAMKPGLDADGILDKTYVYNMNIYDTGTQHVKGADTGVNLEAVIACNTLGYNPGVVRGDYIGAIGIFEGSDVVVRDNYVYNITGQGTGCNVAAPEEPCIYDTVPAIYMRLSRDSIVERNIIIDSWRGILLGLTNGHVRGIVRNNFIYRSGPGDMGISVEKSVDTIVEHNTVLVGGYWAPMQVRGGSGHVFRNNLTNLPIQLRDGAFDISIQGNGNIEYATQDDLLAPYDPHLNPNSPAVGGGVRPSQVLTDIDGDVRSGRWDVGADQIR